MTQVVKHLLSKCEALSSNTPVVIKDTTRILKKQNTKKISVYTAHSKVKFCFILLSTYTGSQSILIIGTVNNAAIPMIYYIIFYMRKQTHRRRKSTCSGHLNHSGWSSNKKHTKISDLRMKMFPLP
jgi:hypothetical protein